MFLNFGFVSVLWLSEFGSDGVQRSEIGLDYNHG